jgi:hypothetical protein
MAVGWEGSLLLIITNTIIIIIIITQHCSWLGRIFDVFVIAVLLRKYVAPKGLYTVVFGAITLEKNELLFKVQIHQQYECIRTQPLKGYYGCGRGGGGVGVVVV